jgi:hypothetical protein
MLGLPGFTPDGLLPSSDYELTLDQLRASLLVVGPSPRSEHWDEDWRRSLVDNLGIIVHQLWIAGVGEIFADGSFCEDKDHPNDIDGYFVCDARDLGRLQRELNLLDPYKVWTWDARARRRDRESGKLLLPMWHRYRIDMWPHCRQLSGITDEHGHPLEFPAAFRKSRRGGQPRGIVRIGGKP